ncbi:MAG: AI-2E family transporter [Desulfobulbaceae bacterium]|nr:AI-2E family transporter [Desulfobulbaceae bacterium]
MGTEPPLPSPGRLLTVTAWLALLSMTAVVLKALAFLFVPLAVALLFCYALGLPMELLQRLRVPMWLRILLVVFCTALVFYLLGRLVQANVLELQERLPEFEVIFWGYAERVLAGLKMTRPEAQQMFVAFADNFRHADLQPLGSMVGQMGVTCFAFIGNAFWVLLFMVFMLAEKEGMTNRLVRGFGDKRSAVVLAAMARINKAVQRYLGLKIFLSLLTGLLVGVVLKYFGVPFAFLWAVLTFLLNFIPNIGSVIATLPPVAAALFQSGSVTSACLVALALVTVQVVVGNILEPRLMGKGLDLSPLVVLLSLLFWGWMWGVVGMLIAVPLTAAIKIACEQLDATRPLAILMGSEK